MKRIVKHNLIGTFPVLALAATALGAAAQQPEVIGAPSQAANSPDARRAAEALASALETEYLSPDVGRAYAAMLRAKLASGAYDGTGSADDFAKAITADLQAVHPDRHLRLFPPRIDGDGAPRRMPGPSAEGAIASSGWLSDGVAYINFTFFPGNEATLAALQAFLDAHSSAKTLIIDARSHRGGGLAEIDLMFSYFYSQPTELLRIDNRISSGRSGVAGLSPPPTIKRLKGPDGIQRSAHMALPGAQATGLLAATIFLLTSKKTGSAAEHLALALKRTKRATLIGETTYGAGNGGGVIDLGGSYSAFIPRGRTYDPDTDKGWEGTGVQPDVAVPADQALDEALRLAGVAPGKVRPLPN